MDTDEEIFTKTADKSIEIIQTEAQEKKGKNLKGTKDTRATKQYQWSKKCVTGSSTEEMKQRIRNIWKTNSWEFDEVAKL